MLEEKYFIICVDDDRTVLNSLRHELFEGLQRTYRIEIADSGEDGLEIIQELLDSGNQIPVVLSDQLMPGMKGDDFLREVYLLDRRIKKILLTGQATTESVGNAINLADLYRFIPKPWDKKDLLLTVSQAIDSYRTDTELDNYVTDLKKTQ